MWKEAQNIHLLFSVPAKETETKYKNYHDGNEKFSQGKKIFKHIVLAIFRCLDGNHVSRRVDLF